MSDYEPVNGWDSITEKLPTVYQYAKKLREENEKLKQAHIGCDAYWNGQECIPCEKALGPLYKEEK